MEPEEDPFVLTEAEKDTLKRKRLVEEPPATQRSEEYDEDDPLCDDPEGEDEPDQDDDDDEADDLPNIQMYFEQFDIPDEQVISMCRAYASYLVSLRPKTPSKTSAYKAPARQSVSQKVAHWVAKRRRK